MGTLALAFVAGVLSTLSPCVLPLLPLVLGTAVGEHRFGPFALAAGLTISFVAIGLFVATIGFAAGLDHQVFRMAAAVLLILIGAVLLIPRVQAQLAVAAGPLTNWSQQQASGLPTTGLGGQLLMGLMLGAVWAPCVGPTLGAASVLAARGENLTSVAFTMLMFGVGAALPLLLLGLLSREAMLRWRARMLGAGTAGKAIIGAVLVAIGALILTGLDKRVEAALVNASPAWLTELTTRF